MTDSVRMTRATRRANFRMVAGVMMLFAKMEQAEGHHLHVASWIGTGFSGMRTGRWPEVWNVSGALTTIGPSGMQTVVMSPDERAGLLVSRGRAVWAVRLAP